MSVVITSRRRFLRQSAAALAAGATVWPARSGRGFFVDAPQGKDSAELIRGKDSRLIVRSADPVEIETPLVLLREKSITPKSLLFVRNNQSLAGADTVAPLSARAWAVEIAGLIDRPATIAVEDLAAMPQVEHELVLQCSGNGRSTFSKIAPAKGAQWECGAMGNVRFAGVPLAKVLEKLNVKLDLAARFVTAEGKDAPTKPDDADFEHSIPLDDALARSILALSMNGEPLPAVHGGPVRLVTPGYYATMNVKWLTRLRLEAQETGNYHQVRRYRTPKEPIRPGSELTCDLANSDANWRMRTKSVIFAPLEGELVAAGRVAVNGVAWNDGTAPIESVLVAVGEGAAWRPANLAPAAGPYAWRHWSLTLELPRGEHQIAARAVDALGRSQPLSAVAQWNPAGYACNAVHAIKVIAS